MRFFFIYLAHSILLDTVLSNRAGQYRKCWELSWTSCRRLPEGKLTPFTRIDPTPPGKRKQNTQGAPNLQSNCTSRTLNTHTHTLALYSHIIIIIIFSGRVQCRTFDFFAYFQYCGELSAFARAPLCFTPKQHSPCVFLSVVQLSSLSGEML